MMLGPRGRQWCVLGVFIHPHCSPGGPPGSSCLELGCQNPQVLPGHPYHHPQSPGARRTPSVPLCCSLTHTIAFSCYVTLGLGILCEGSTSQTPLGSWCLSRFQVGKGEQVPSAPKSPSRPRVSIMPLPLAPHPSLEEGVRPAEGLSASQFSSLPCLFIP